MSHSLLRRYLVAVIATGAALLVHLLLHPFLLDGQVVYIILFAAVMLVNLYSGFGPALMALGLGGAGAIYFMPEAQLAHRSVALVELASILFYFLVGIFVLLGQAVYQARAIALQLDQQRTSEVLRENEARLRAIFYQSAFGMAQADLNGRHVLVNDAYCELTGFSREALLNCTFLDITHPGDIDHNRQLFQQLMSGVAQRYEMEKRYIQKSGAIIWVQVSVAFIMGVDGLPRYVVAGVQDISERKRKEQTLGFLVNLNNATQQLTDPQEVMKVTAQMLGEHLDVDRCAYAEVESDQDHFTITGDYTRGVNSIVGRFSMAAFGAEVLRLMRLGQPYVVHDVATDPQVGPDPSAYHATQIASVVCVPIHKAGQFAACMAVHQQVPRYWSDEEIELIQLVVARCWESIERARTVRNLQASEQRMRFVLDSMPQKIFTATPDGLLDYLNPQWTSFAGLPFNDFRKRGERDLVHPDDLKKNQVAWYAALASGNPLDLEHRFRNSEGEYRWHMTRALPMRDAKGNIAMWIGSNTDIHALKLAEEAAVQRSEQVRQLASIATRLNTTSDTATVMETVTRVARDLIPSHLAVMSCTIDDDWAQAVTSVSLSPKYQHWQTYTGAPDGTGIYARVCQTNTAMRLTQAQLEAHHDWNGFGAEAGRHPPLRGWLAAPLIAQGGGNIGVLQISDKFEGDFTADDEAVLVQLAQMTSVALENARLVEGLRQADRRKDEFLATLAHELRNPLAPIRNMLEILKRMDNASPVVEKAHLVMERQLVHMVRLIDDLLDVSRVSEGKLDLRMEIIALSPAITQTVDAFQSMITAAGHTLHVSLPTEPIYLQADPTRIAQMIGNLLDNACKYTNVGGVIQLSAVRESNEMVLRVKDNGIGIPPDKLNDIFDLFSQVDRSLERLRAGLGIGLTLVKRLVEMHRGSIVAYSAGRGEGSEFIIRLPVVENLPAAEYPVVTNAISPPIPRRILIVDDNEDAASSLATLLELNGEHTATAFDGVAALEVAEGFCPHIILLDIGLPKLNGYEVCRKLRAGVAGTGLVIIAISGWGQERDRQQSAAAGFDHHLVKPLDFAVLQQLLGKYPTV